MFRHLSCICVDYEQSLFLLVRRAKRPRHVHGRVHSPYRLSNGGGKSLKSGKESKITTAVLYPQLWPHSFLSVTNARRDIKYDDLTLQEFVAGYGQILQSPDLTEMERSARLKHLVFLMYFAQQYEWQVVDRARPSQVGRFLVSFREPYSLRAS